MVDSKHMTFIPDEEPGGYALGLPLHPDDLGRMAAHKLRMAKMPTGAAVAERFPWWRKVHDTVFAGEQQALLRAGWPATFINVSDHDVQVDEIRFYTPWSGATTDYQTLLMCKIGIHQKKSIIADWTPVQVLHTEISRMLAANIDSFTYELPAPYVLQRGNQFVMDMRYNVAYLTNMASEDWVIMAGLHGYGLQDGEPISLIKPVRGWPQPTGLANQWQTIAFDEEQGRPMRDAVITHITFGSAMTTNVARVLEALEFRPHAPEGPEWTQGEFYCLRDVAEQVGIYALLDHWCIHRPIVPYNLDRGEGILIELWNRSAVDVAVDVILRGSQGSRR